MRSPAGKYSPRTICRLSSIPGHARAAETIFPMGIAKQKAIPFYQAMLYILKLHLFYKVRSRYLQCWIVPERMRGKGCFAEHSRTQAFVFCCWLSSSKSFYCKMGSEGYQRLQKHGAYPQLFLASLPLEMWKDKETSLTSNPRCWTNTFFFFYSHSATPPPVKFACREDANILRCCFHKIEQSC